jgi:preprotein translocase subunit SecD
MIVYYRWSGALACTAMILNLVIEMAILAKLRATLTLPGVAGLILTIGMSVDANVLIFERMREELAKGKTVRAAIEAGYDRAFNAILDSNVTTLITAFVLWQFGTGPVKGFATTLSIGIICSMFTALVCTRVVYDLITTRRHVNALSV